MIRPAKNGHSLVLGLVGGIGRRLCRPRFHSWPDKPIKHPENRSRGSVAERIILVAAWDESFVSFRLSGTFDQAPCSLHRFIMEKQKMTKLKILGAACVSLALVATPALARPGGAGSHGAAHFSGGGARFAGGGAHFAGGGARFAGGHFHGGGFRGGVGPGIAAGVIAGAALGGYAYNNGYGPGYYGDSYAYDDGYNAPGYDNGYAVGPGYVASPGYVAGPGYDNGYARLNGFVCQPGTLFRGEDGRTHLCQ
jgi:hypothetical protein